MFKERTLRILFMLEHEEFCRINRAVCTTSPWTHKLKKRSDKKPLKFNTWKCKVMSLGQNKS